MRKFSVRPTLTMKGRTFKGPRGLSGKPSHPPLTDVPIAAYLVAAVFDVISTIAGDIGAWADELWHAGTYLFIAGVIVSVFAALTGLADARDSSEAGHPGQAHDQHARCDHGHRHGAGADQPGLAAVAVQRR
nr:DUF2231 domain-containing protein [Candidatus Microthrix sp.]